MNPHRLAAVALGLLLAGPAAGLLAAEPAEGPASGPGGEDQPAEPPKPKIKVPPRAELDRMIFRMGARVDTFYETRKKLRDYLEAEDNGRVLEALKEALPKADKLQRFHIVRVLGDWGQPEGLALIAPYIADKDDSVQRAAMSGVTRAKTPDPTALHLIRPLLTSEDDNVQKEAILSVGRMKDFESVPLLIELLRVDNAGLRTNVLWALREITGKDFGADVDAWLAWLEFYEREVAVKDQPGGQGAKPSAGSAPGAAAAAGPGSGSGAGAGAGSAAAVGPGGQIAAVLGLALLAVAAGWAGCRWWLRSTMTRLVGLEPAAARDPAVIALRFAPSDYLPDWVVYPYLAGRITGGSVLEASVALHVLMFRVHGGCSRTAINGGRLAEGEPARGARQRVLGLPRGLLADLALAGNPAGRCLIRLIEPDNPFWQREPTAREKLIAERHLASLLKRER